MFSEKIYNKTHLAWFYVRPPCIWTVLSNAVSIYEVNRYIYKKWDAKIQCVYMSLL